MSFWEKITLAIIAIGVLFFVVPRLGAVMEKSRDAPKDWRGVLVPIGLVVLFVLFLLSTA